MKGYDSLCRIWPIFVDKIDNLSFNSSKLLFLCIFLMYFFSRKQNDLCDRSAKFETKIIRSAILVNYSNLILWKVTPRFFYYIYILLFHEYWEVNLHKSALEINTIPKLKVNSFHEFSNFVGKAIHWLGGWPWVQWSTIYSTGNPNLPSKYHYVWNKSCTIPPKIFFFYKRTSNWC